MRGMILLASAFGRSEVLMRVMVVFILVVVVVILLIRRRR